MSTHTAKEVARADLQMLLSRSNTTPDTATQSLMSTYTTKDKKRVLRAYKKYGSAAETARHVEPWPRTIRRWADDAGIKKSPGEVRYSKEEKKHVLRAYKKYRSARETARHVDPSPRTIRKWAGEAGIKRSRSEIQSETQKDIPEEVIDRAENLYVAGKLSIREIADLLGVGATGIHRRLKERGVSRSLSEAGKIRSRKNGYPERAKETCRLRASTDLTWPEIAERRGISETACLRHWNSEYNPYRTGQISSEDVDKIARKACRLRHEEGKKWREVAEEVGRSPSRCREYWNSDRNPYRSDEKTNVN